MNGKTTRVARLLMTVVTPVWLSVGLPSSTVLAHTLDTEGFSAIAQRGDDVLYDLWVDYAAFATVVGLGTPGDPNATNPSETLRTGRPRVAAYLDQRLKVFVDGLACEGSVEDTAVEQRSEDAYARISLRYECPGTGAYEIRYGVFLGDVDPGHTNVTSYELAAEQGTFLFDADNRVLRLGEGSLSGSIFRFVGLGFHHILVGLDHVLFVVALLIGSRSLRRVLEVVTAFTLAHSVTLLLAAMGWVRVPSSLVEPLIALSIAYVAAENLFGRASWTRRVTVFGFGLLHGMGFAGTLELTGAVDWPMFLSLLSFNAGVELGQGLIVALVFPLLLLLRRYEWSVPAQVGATGVIAVLGFVWFFDRLLLA